MKYFTLLTYKFNGNIEQGVYLKTDAKLKIEKMQAKNNPDKRFEFVSAEDFDTLVEANQARIK